MIGDIIKCRICGREGEQPVNPDCWFCRDIEVMIEKEAAGPDLKIAGLQVFGSAAELANYEWQREAAKTGYRSQEDM